VLVLFLIYPIFRYKIDIDKIAKISGVVMAVFTGVSFLIIVVLMDLPISSVYYTFFSNYSSGSNGLREFSEESSLSFHIGTVPFLYLPYCLFVISYMDERKIIHLFASFVLFLTIFISASRGLILSCIMATVCIIFFKSKLSNRIIFLSVSIPVVFFTFYYLLYNTSVFDSSEESNSVKIGHYESFIDQIGFFNFFLGEGLASYYYSKGAQGMKAHTELTPIDMVRYLGFILTPLLYLVIIFPTKRVSSYLGSNFLYVILFLIYVFNSFTNPTFFNSYGLLLVLWYWCKILNKSNSDHENSFVAQSI
jgi:hypothetical protein